MAAAELLKWQLIEFGDLVQGRLIRESPKSIDETGRGVIEMIIWFKRQTIRSLKLKPIVGVEWDLKRCVDELGNQMADTQMFKKRYPAEMILLPEIFIQDDGAIDRKVRVLCGVDGESTQLTDLHCNYLEKIRFLEKKLAVMSGSLHAKEYDEGLARADVATYLSHHVDIVAMAKGKKHIDTVDEDEEKLRGEELKKKRWLAMDEIKPKEIDTPKTKLDEFKKTYNQMFNEITSKSTDDTRRQQVQEMQALYGKNMAMEIGGIAKPIIDEIGHSDFDYQPNIRLINPFIRRNIDMWLTNQKLDDRNKGYIKTLFDLSHDAIKYVIELLEENTKQKEKLEQEKNKLSDKDIEEQRKEHELERAKSIQLPETRKRQLEDWYDKLPITKDGQLGYIRQCNPKLTQLKPNEIQFIQQINNEKHKWVGKLSHLVPPTNIIETQKTDKIDDVPDDLPKPLED